MAGLRRRLSHPVADEGVEHVAKSCESSFVPFPEVLAPMGGIESDRGHGGLLTKFNGYDVPTRP